MILKLMLLISLISLTKSMDDISSVIEKSGKLYHNIFGQERFNNFNTHNNYNDNNSKNKNSNHLTFNQYLRERQNIIADEAEENFASDVVLSEREEIANAIIMKAKYDEINAGIADPVTFAPGQHFFKAYNQINHNSTLFRILRKLPKGGLLHIHDITMTSPDYLISLTYRKNVWQCSSKGVIMYFRFSREDLNDDPNFNNLNCTWTRVSTERARIGKRTYDKQLRPYFTMFTSDPDTAYPDVNAAYNKLGPIFDLVDGLVLFAPVFKEYYKEALREMYADGIQYLEFRVAVPQVYDHDNPALPVDYTIQLYVDGLKEYMEENPYFIGSKMIVSGERRVPTAQFDSYLNLTLQLYERFPDFIVGFNLIGQEDFGPSLFDYAKKLLNYPKEIKFFFHAGETNWYGLSSDRNLIDAIVMGTKRIGHGYAAVKHPEVLKLVKKLDIPLEICPISNQVLRLIDDFRNHPAAHYFATNVPMVIASDYPGYWSALPLSHDFYEAFLGIVSAESDLRTLKKWAINSIKYSSLSKRDKEIGLKKWQYKWNKFINSFIDN